MVILFIDPVGKRKFAHFVRANPIRESVVGIRRALTNARAIR
jgi:hypothetical protein